MPHLIPTNMEMHFDTSELSTSANTLQVTEAIDQQTIDDTAVLLPRFPGSDFVK